MAADPYTTLGLKRDATAAQIKSAYLKLAKKHHPDVNPGNAKAEERFKTINAAHDLLSDPEKRAQFDAGAIDASGQPKGPPPGARAYASAGRPGGAFSPSFTGPGPEGLQDMFADIFANVRGGGQARDNAMRGQDQRFQLTVSFLEAALGANRRLTLPEGRTLDVAIPAGLEDGQSLRLRGQGSGGWNGAPAGDALIEVSVAQHAYFKRQGRDILLDLPVTAGEAVNGAKVAVPTLTGRVNLSIPRHSEAGRQLRLRGRGLPAVGGASAGDLYVTLRIVLGEPDAALEEALAAFYARKPFDPRAGM